MAEATCWYVSCSNYGRPSFFCEHGDPVTGGQAGSEAGCYR